MGTKKKAETRAGRPPKTEKIRKAEAKAIEDALERSVGNVNRAAAELGLPRRTLYHQCKQYEIDPNDFRPAGWKYEGPFGAKAENEA